MQKRDLLLLLTLTLALPTSHLSAQDRSPLQLGITLGGGVVMEEGGMEHLGFGAVSGTSLNVLILYDERAEGMALFGGLAGSLDLGSRIRLEMSSRVETRRATYEAEGSMPTLAHNYQDPQNPLVVDERRGALLTTKHTLLLGDLGVSWRLADLGATRLRINVGIEAGVLLRGTERREIRVNGVRAADWGGSIYNPPPSPLPSTWPIPWGTMELPIKNLSTLTLNLQGGLSLDIPLTDRLTLVPSAFYCYPLTEIVPDSDWRSHMIGGAVDLMWRL